MNHLKETMSNIDVGLQNILWCWLTKPELAKPELAKPELDKQKGGNMLIKSYSGDGNSIAAYSIHLCICDRCAGRGEIDVDKEEFIEWLEDTYFEMEGIVKSALRDYRQWKKYGSVTCPECNGKGEWEVMR